MLKGCIVTERKNWQYRIHYTEPRRDAYTPWADLKRTKIVKARDDKEAITIASHLPYRVSKLEKIITPARKEKVEDLTNLLGR